MFIYLFNLYKEQKSKNKTLWFYMWNCWLGAVISWSLTNMMIEADAPGPVSNYSFNVRQSSWSYAGCHQHLLIRYFCPFPATPMVPTCEILHTTAPSAWTSNSLTSMSSSAFSNCLELMGHDQFLASYQHSQVLKRVKQVRFRLSPFNNHLTVQGCTGFPLLGPALNTVLLLCLHRVPLE